MCGPLSQSLTCTSSVVSLTPGAPPRPAQRRVEAGSKPTKLQARDSLEDLEGQRVAASEVVLVTWTTLSRPTVVGKTLLARVTSLIEVYFFQRCVRRLSK